MYVYYHDYFYLNNHHVGQLVRLSRYNRFKHKLATEITAGAVNKDTVAELGGKRYYYQSLVGITNFRVKNISPC